MPVDKDNSLDNLYETILQALHLLRGYQIYLEQDLTPEDGEFYSMPFEWDDTNIRISVLETMLSLIERN